MTRKKTLVEGTLSTLTNRLVAIFPILDLKSCSIVDQKSKGLYNCKRTGKKEVYIRNQPDTLWSSTTCSGSPNTETDLSVDAGAVAPWGNTYLRTSEEAVINHDVQVYNMLHFERVFKDCGVSIDNNGQ